MKQFLRIITLLVLALFFPGAYATINGTAVTFHYYTQDYLGNNRAVINGTTGAVEQTTAYYPYGSIIADLGNPHGGQPYKFGGKELITSKQPQRVRLRCSPIILHCTWLHQAGQ